MRHIVADENIPYVREAFRTYGRVTTRPGRAIGPDVVREADVLLVRSVTRVDAALLAGSPVGFVGSATIGTDHVDRAWLGEQGIAFAHAPGSNAESVVEYVLAALLHLAVARRTPLSSLRVGIVGCGAIGGRLARRLPALGVEVLLNDPPRARAAKAAGEPHSFVPLSALLAEADVVTLHTPLVASGPWPTRHLIDAQALAQMRPSAWLLNTSRGAVVDNAALGEALGAGRLGAVALDVWENEPTPDPALVEQVDLATPHIAGYSLDGKVAGTRMLHEALAAHLGAPAAWHAEEVLALAPHERRLDPPAEDDPTAWLHALAQSMYDVAADDRRMRAYLEEPTAARQAAFFSRLRKGYPVRRSFRRYRLEAGLVPAALRRAVYEGLAVGRA